MTKRQLNESMDAREVMEWMAYEMSIDTDNNKKYMAEIAKERALDRPLEAEADGIRALLLGLGGKD